MNNRCRNCFRDDQPLNDENRCGRCIAEMIRIRAEARLPEIVNDALRSVGLPELEAKPPRDRRHCKGCEDDFYNGNNPLGVKQCWSLKTARLVTRWRLPSWQQPTVAGAFVEVLAYDCRREKGFVFYEELPLFAIDPVRLRVSEEVRRG